MVLPLRSADVIASAVTPGPTLSENVPPSDWPSLARYSSALSTTARRLRLGLSDDNVVLGESRSAHQHGPNHRDKNPA